jgi:hypothetical protein
LIRNRKLPIRGFIRFRRMICVGSAGLGGDAACVKIIVLSCAGDRSGRLTAPGRNGTRKVSKCDGMQNVLNPERALIFRIVHRDNLGWILKNGLRCRNSHATDPNYITIGNPDLISKRNHRIVSTAPGGTLSDYIPFYFTPLSPMLYNIKTGYNGIRRCENREIAMLVSSLPRLKRDSVSFLFTDRHAYLQAAQFYSDLRELCNVDWTILQRRDFKRDVDDLEKVERYQAEALVHRHLPTRSLVGVVCYDDATVASVHRLVESAGAELRVVPRPEWYF